MIDPWLIQQRYEERLQQAAAERRYRAVRAARRAAHPASALSQRLLAAARVLGRVVAQPGASNPRPRPSR